MHLWSRIVSSENFFHVCQTCHPRAIVEYIGRRLKKSGVEGNVAEILARSIVDGGEEEESESEPSYSRRHSLASNASSQYDSQQPPDDSQFNFVGSTSPDPNTSPDSHISSTLSPTNLQQNQAAFLRNVSGGTLGSTHETYDEYEYPSSPNANQTPPNEFDGGSDGYDEYEYGGDYDSDYEQDSGGEGEEDPLKKTSPRSGLNIPKIGRTFSEGSDTGAAQGNNNRHPQNFLHNPSALNRETSINSSFSDIPEDDGLNSDPDDHPQPQVQELMGSNTSLTELKVNHDMSALTISPDGLYEAARRISPPIKTQSPPINVNDKNKPRDGNGNNSSLPPPPPGGDQPSQLFRSMSTDDAYSSDEDHVEEGAENYSPAKPTTATVHQHKPVDRIKEIVKEPFTPSPVHVNVNDTDNDGTVSSINSSSGSVGKRYVKEALTRPHPKGATVSRKERVRKGKWRKGQKIGSGSFGTVYLGMNEASGTLMAIKTMNIANAEQADIADLQQEIDVMRILSHPNIVRYFGAELDDEEGSLNIFQEWVPGGSVASLLSRLGAFSVNVVKSYLKQTLSGLSYLHKNHIIHRDMKGANLLVDNNGTVKLADFGASKKMSDEGTLNGSQMKASMKGTPYFMAPEVMSHEKYGRKADMWSTGGVAFQMITGEAPWKSLGLRTPVALFYHIQTGEDPPPLPDKIKKDCPGLCRIILRCFARDPAKRPTSATLLDDEWFKEDEGDDDSETTMSEGGIGDDWIDAEDDDHQYDDDNRQRTNSGSTGVQPDRRRTASSGSKHHKFGENGYAEVAAFDVQTAKKRAELKSQRGNTGNNNNNPNPFGNNQNGNSPTYAEIPQNASDLLQGKDIKQIKGSRPVTTATGRQWADVEKKVEERRPATTKVGRSETPYEDAEEIPQEWPSWAKEKAQVKAQIMRSSTEGTKKSGSSTPPGPPARDSPASQYSTPQTGLTKGNPFGDTGDVGVSILREESDEDSSIEDEYMSPKNEERIALGGNPFETGSSPTHNKITGPKPSTDSPTSLMAGPRIDQYLEESIAKVPSRRGSNGSDRRGSNASNNSRKGSNSSASDRRRSSGDRSSLVRPPPTNELEQLAACAPVRLGNPKSPSSPRVLAQTNPQASREVDPDNWICAHCDEKNANEQEYCGGCAKWKKVAGGATVRRGEDRAVVNLGEAAWESTVRSNNFGGQQQNNIGAMRHLQRAHTVGTHGGGNSSSRSGGGTGGTGGGGGGSRSAGGGTQYRKKFNKL
ncbi:hypothetical protein TL16_g10879 [Triparma laevis f. inornata]|uniref:Protein kinase domain-containing protein n=1 Tax=Triparma laevis f. inornata TaxID=1714386 RepID=A0A9W7BIE3_9STRA|nr:hypothetical protein TL16_g10879 [Triparma laevis f. inornata]